jgi:hypothetical protein
MPKPKDKPLSQPDTDARAGQSREADEQRDTAAQPDHETEQPQAADNATPTLEQLQQALDVALNEAKTLREEKARIQTELDKLTSPNMMPFKVDGIADSQLDEAAIEQILNNPERRLYQWDDRFSGNHRTYFVWKNEKVAEAWLDLGRAAQAAKDKLNDTLFGHFKQYQQEAELDLKEAI